MLSEALYRLSRLRIKRIEVALDAGQEPAVLTIAPKAKSTVRSTALHAAVKLPLEFARGAVQSDDLQFRRIRIKRTTDDERSGLGFATLVDVESPGKFKSSDVLGSDLGQRRVPVPVHVTAINRPIGLRSHRKNTARQ